MRRKCCCAKRAVLVATGLLMVLARDAIGQVVINEIMYNPGPDATAPDSDYEFVELYNTTASDISFGDSPGWTLVEGGDTHTLTGTIAGYGFYVLTNKGTAGNPDVAGFRDYYNVPSGATVAYFGLGLLNSGESLTLKHGTGQIESFTYGTGAPWPSVSENYSLERYDPGVSGSQASNWAESLVAKGTPGRVNSVVPEPANFALFAVGAACLLGVRRTRVRRRAEGKDS